VEMRLTVQRPLWKGPSSLTIVEFDTRTNALISRLRERGYRVTPQRAAVVKALVRPGLHPTVEQIYGHVRGEFPMTSRATVYKTLAVLRDMGAVCELRVGGGGIRYDGCADQPHPHLVCTTCGRICDLDLAPVENTIAEIEERTGYRIVSHRRDFFGVCPDCQRGDKHDQSG